MLLLQLLTLLEAGGFLFASERIFTVMTVVLIIFCAVVFMLIRIERKLNRLEKHLHDEK